MLRGVSKLTVGTSIQAEEDREKIADMDARTPRLVVDRYSKVLRGLVGNTLLVLIAVWGVTMVVEVFSKPGASTVNVVDPYIDALFLLFVWKDPAVVLAVVVPLAIALQVAVHGLRVEQGSSVGRLEQPSRLREHELERIKAFSNIAIMTASLITTFTAFTMLDRFFGRSDDPDVSMAITVALCGFVTAVLCLDAARVATTQDLEQELLAAQALQFDRQRRLDSLKRDIASQRFAWLTSGALLILLLVLPVAVSEYSDMVFETTPPPPGGSELVARILLVIALSLIFALALAVNFGALLTFTVASDLGRLARTLTFLLLVLPTCFFVFAGIYGKGAPWIIKYALAVFPALALLSMLFAWIQGTRGTSSWITKANFGFHALLRFYAVSILSKLLQGSNEHVSWLEDALHEPVIGPGSSGTKDQPKPRSIYTRLSSFLATVIRR